MDSHCSQRAMLKGQGSMERKSREVQPGVRCELHGEGLAVQGGGEVDDVGERECRP